MGEKDTENERRVVLVFARLSPNKIAECSVTQRWFLSREMLLFEVIQKQTHYGGKCLHPQWCVGNVLPLPASTKCLMALTTVDCSCKDRPALSDKTFLILVGSWFLWEFFLQVLAEVPLHQLLPSSVSVLRFLPALSDHSSRARTHLQTKMSSGTSVTKKTQILALPPL